MIKLIKLNARRALNNSWSTAVTQVLILEGVSLLAFLISSLTYGILSFDGLLRDLRFPPPEAIISSAIILLVFFAFISPFTAGIRAWYYKLSEKGEGAPLSFCFLPYESFGTILNSVKLSFILAVKKLFTYALFTCIPLAIRFYSRGYLMAAQTPRESFLASSSLLCGTLLTLLAVVFAYVRCLKYFAVPYFFAESNFTDVKGAFKASAKACKEAKGSLLLFNLSLIFYYILNLCPLTALYSYPYIQSAKSIYGRFLAEREKRETAGTAQN